MAFICKTRLAMVMSARAKVFMSISIVARRWAWASVSLTRAYVDEFYGKTELSKLKSVEPSERCRAESVSAVPIPLARLYASPQTLLKPTKEWWCRSKI